MKKNGLRIMLALVIALTLVIGSASVVSAAPHPKASVIITGFPFDTVVTFNYSWNHLAVDYYYLRVAQASSPSGPWTNIYTSGNYGDHGGNVTRTDQEHGTQGGIVSGYYYRVGFNPWGKKEHDLGIFWSPALFYGD
jgi:hypothetical protein